MASYAPSAGGPSRLEDPLAGSNERRHAVRGVICGVLSGILGYAVLVSGSLPGAVPLLLAAVLLVLVPSAQPLARRVALNAALLVGWLPLLWWVDWPFDVNHGSAVVSLALGSTVALVSGAPDPRTRLRGLAPTVRRSDVLLLVALVVPVAAMHKWAFAGSPRAALAALVPGADNYAHFNMFTSLRAYGATPEAIGRSADGSGWAFDNYPKGFHSLVASISELTTPDLGASPQALPAYTHAVTVLVVLGMVLLVATILSLPRLGSRPAIAAPVVALVCTALLWEPGQKVLANGFASFWLGAVAASCALLLALSSPRSLVVVELAAVGGLLVCVAHTWLPLGLIAGPALLIVLTADKAGRRLRDDHGRLIATVLVVGLSAAAVLKAAVILLTTVEIGFVVSEVSGFDGTSPLPTFILLVGGTYVLLSYPSWTRLRGREGTDTLMNLRVRLLAGAVLVGVVSLAVLLAVQLNALGSTSYYFLKYLLGFELILAGVVPAVCGMLLAAVTSPMPRRARGIALSLVAVLCATLFFGRLSPGDALLLSDTDDGTASVDPPYTRTGIADGVLAAVAASTPSQSFERDYLPLGEGNAAQVFYPDAWYHAVNASVTLKVFKRFVPLRTNVEEVDDAVPLVRELLSGDEALSVIVPPDYVEPLRDGLGSADLARRVLSWDAN